MREESNGRQATRVDYASERLPRRPKRQEEERPKASAAGIPKKTASPRNRLWGWVARSSRRGVDADLLEMSRAGREGDRRRSSRASASSSRKSSDFARTGRGRAMRSERRSLPRRTARALAGDRRDDAPADKREAARPRSRRYTDGRPPRRSRKRGEKVTSSASVDCPSRSRSRSDAALPARRAKARERRERQHEEMGEGIRVAQRPLGQRIDDRAVRAERERSGPATSRTRRAPQTPRRASHCEGDQEQSSIAPACESALDGMKDNTQRTPEEKLANRSEVSTGPSALSAKNARRASENPVGHAEPQHAPDRMQDKARYPIAPTLRRPPRAGRPAHPECGMRSPAGSRARRTGREGMAG